MADLIEHLAEALWQAESMRATDKPRRSPWADESDATKERWRYEARAALSAIEAAGYRVVPVEPTEAMVVACKGALRDFILKLPQQAREVNKRRHGGIKIDPRTKTVIRYAAMLAAAPKVTP